MIRSFLSLPFFKPPKAIFVPGMYFFGFSKYANYFEYVSTSVLRIDRPGGMGTNKSILFPLDALLLVCVGVREALNLTGLAAKQTVQIGPDLVSFTLFQIVALRASCLSIRSAAEVAFSSKEESMRWHARTLKRLAPFFASPVRLSISFHAITQ